MLKKALNLVEKIEKIAVADHPSTAGKYQVVLQKILIVRIRNTLLYILLVLMGSPSQTDYLSKAEILVRIDRTVKKKISLGM